ncbi:hypothetical protein [Bacillus altitudinis]|uniref:hypothetical protein n=1 Tax=Bacillus altitudinis TaxID=293387 RepID=UPI001643B744|nr:hypothetical protein [Bacillus altitudinis]
MVVENLVDFWLKMCCWDDEGVGGGLGFNRNMDGERNKFGGIGRRWMGFFDLKEVM